MSTKNEIKQSQVIKRVLVELKTYRLQIVLSLICAVLTVIFTLLVPVLTGKAVDCMIGSGQIQWDGLYQILEKMALAIVGTCFFQWLMNRINNYITYDITKNMRQKAFEKMLVMPIKNIDSHSHGDYMSRIATDADVFSDGLLMGFTQLFTGVLTILGTIFFMVRVSLPIALVVIALTPVSLLVAKFVASRTYAMFQLQAKHRGEQTAYADEMIENQSVVSAFSYNEKAKEEFDVLNDRLADSSFKATFYSSITNPTTRFVNSLIYSGVGVAGAILAIFGGITVGGLTSFLGYASQYAKPFNEISGVVTELQNAIACAARIFEIIDAPAVEESRENHLSDVEGKIVFEDVAFSYDPSKPLIEHLNLTVEPGQRIAIVGPTGSGKTTLINLLMRFYDPDSGRITLEDHDILHSARKSVRRAYTMVLQDTWLFSGTIAENIAYGSDREVSREEIEKAAKAAGIHSFIKGLPEGYDTVLTDEGVNISKGQKQLITIARAMISSSPVLILDEATSNVDSMTEMRIQRAMNELMSKKTSIVIAHRLSTVRNADVIFVLHDGRVIEHGSHDSLMAQKGFYYSLHNAQFS